MTIYETLKEEIKTLPTETVLNEHIEEIYLSLEGIPTTFITFDIDNFIKVNDDCGYPAGDKVIYRFYSMIRDSFSKLLATDNRNRFSRMGGDEFGVMLVNQSTQEITEAVNQVLTTMRTHDFSQEGCAMALTTSVGLVTTSKIEHPRDLYHQSSKALIEAKRSGRDQYVMRFF